LAKVSTGVGLFAALAGPPLFVLIPDRVFGVAPTLGIQILLQLLYCSLAGLVIWIVIRCERLPLRSIGLRRPDRFTLVWGLVLLCAISALPLVTKPVVAIVGRRGVEEGVHRLAVLPLWFRTVIGLTGGSVEEILYRGYAVERLATILGNPWAAGALSAIIFGIAHIPGWGVGFALTADLPFGILMTAFYLWRRDLAANILAHSTALVASMLAIGTASA
jgi:membrane protease YdiL (CAAX protease family)